MPKFGKYSGNSGAVGTDIFLASNGTDTITYTLSDIIAAVGSVTLNDHSTGQTFDADDMGQIHRFTAAAANTLPTITAGMIGQFIDIRKRTSGNISLTCGGADVIKNDSGDDTVLNNNVAGQLWAGIRLTAEALGVWGIESALGDWI